MFNSLCGHIVYLTSPTYASVVSTPDPATDPRQGLGGGTYYVTATAQALFPDVPGTMSGVCQIQALMGDVVENHLGIDITQPTSGTASPFTVTAVVHAQDHDQIWLACYASNVPAGATLDIADGLLTMVRVDQSVEGTG
jgi:hypothetical protein